MHYIDLHTHTERSDGFYSPEALMQLAGNAGICMLAITDHNQVLTELKTLSGRYGVTLIQGCEFSAMYHTADGKTVELHIVGLDFDPTHPQIQAVLRRNQQDRKPYIDRILARLRDCDIEIGTYEDLLAKTPKTRHLGRMVIAREMVERGFVSSVDEAFARYIGAFGERLAYVQNQIEYVDLKTCISAILAADGIPVLAHLYYYQLSEKENRQLLSDFRALTGPVGGMEVHYALYDDVQRQNLLRYSQEFGLYPSAGSDFHGWSKTDTLFHQFPSTIYQAMKEAKKNRR